MGHHKVYAALGQPRAHLAYHQLGNAVDILARELAEHDYVVHAVEELGAHGLLERLHHLVPHQRPLALVAALAKAHGALPPERRRAHVGGHDYHGVLEVDGAALAVGQAAVLHYLQEQVEHIGVRLLYLVEQHHRIGLAAHLLGQLAALLVAHVAGRRAYHARHGVLFHVFAHVHAYQRLLVAEHGLGQRLAQLGLAHARGAHEYERAHRALGVLQARARAAHRPRRGRYGLVLPYHALVQHLLQAQQARALALGEARDRYARPGGHYLGHLLGVHYLLMILLVLLPLLAQHIHLRLQALFLVAHGGGLFKVLIVYGLGLFGVQLIQGRLLLLEVERRGVGAYAHARGRLVDEVNRLVGQEAVVYVARGQVHRRLQRFIGYAHLVMGLIPVAQAEEHLQRLGLRGLADHDRLKAARQRGVLFDVLAVLGKRGRAHALQLPAREHGLEYVGRVYRALGGARAHYLMQLVYEQYHVRAALELVHHGLEPLLELAAILGAGQHGRYVQREHALAREYVGNVARSYALRQRVHYRALAHARLAYQHGVVLGAAREYLHYALYLALPAHHRVQLAPAGLFGQVDAVLIELGRFDRAGLLALAQRGQQLLARLAQVHAQPGQHMRRHALGLAHYRQQYVLRAHVVDLELHRLARAHLHHLLGAGGEGHLAGGRGLLLAPAYEREYRVAHLVYRKFIQYHARSARVVHYAQQQMLGANIAAARRAGLRLGDFKRALHALRKACKKRHF